MCIRDRAKILPAEMANVPIPKVLDIGGFDLDRALSINDAFLEPEYPFEWAGVYSLPAGKNVLSLETGPDPEMSLICYPLPNDGQPELTDVAEAVFRYWANAPTSIGSVGKIDPGVSRWLVDLNQRAEIELELSEGGSFALFTEHTPEEFNSVMKNAGGDEILPLKQHYFDAGHTHDDTVGSVALEIEGDLDSKKLNDWFSVLLQTEGPNIFRMKGILSVKGSEERMVFQGVHMLFDSQPGELWGSEPRHNRLVFIGRELNEDYLQETLKLCLA